MHVLHTFQQFKHKFLLHELSLHFLIVSLLHFEHEIINELSIPLIKQNFAHEIQILFLQIEHLIEQL